jgi:hypothetical protein
MQEWILRYMNDECICIYGQTFRRQTAAASSICLFIFYLWYLDVFLGARSGKNGVQPERQSEREGGYIRQHTHRHGISSDGTGRVWVAGFEISAPISQNERVRFVGEMHWGRDQRFQQGSRSRQSSPCMFFLLSYSRSCMVRVGWRRLAAAVATAASAVTAVRWG